MSDSNTVSAWCPSAPGFFMPKPTPKKNQKPKICVVFVAFVVFCV